MVAAPARDAAIFAPPFPDRGYGALEGPQGLWVCALGVTQHSLVLFWLCHLFYSDAFLKAVRVRGKERFGSRLAPPPPVLLDLSCIGVEEGRRRVLEDSWAPQPPPFPES